MSDARHGPRDNANRAGNVDARVRFDTIVAVGTATGRSALAVVRLSGPDVERIGRAVISPWPTRARTMSRCMVRDPSSDGRVVDDGLAVVFPAPGSYTGETVLEVHTHGGSYVPGAVLSAFIAAGARQALPGEFTERAVHNGKLDLVRAEAIGALIDARTTAAHRSAIHAVSGHLSRAYAALRDAAIDLDALIAYDIDFPDEDHGPLARARVEEAASQLSARLDALVDSAPAATLARDGALVVLAGPPNAGKSTLFNAFVGEARAIVSDVPGTTRDAIEVLLDTEPWPIRLVDTAGLRRDPDGVERLGIEVSERYLKNADVVVLCADSVAVLNDARIRIGEMSGATVVAVHTKADLRAPALEEKAALVSNGTLTVSALAVSALTGAGTDVLTGRIMTAISARAGADGDVPGGAATARQRAAILTASAEISVFLDAWRSGSLPSPVVATHLRAATAALDQLIGTIDTDDVLARVFSTFCVGK